MRRLIPVLVIGLVAADEIPQLTLEAAEKAYLEVLKGGGRLPFVYNNLGTVYQQRGNQERAGNRAGVVDQYSELRRLAPQAPGQQP